MGKIIFVKTINGEPNPAFDFIMNLWDRADLPETDPNHIDTELPMFIQQGLEKIEEAKDFPVGKYQHFYSLLEIDETRSIEQELVRPLIGLSPIYELKVDYKPAHFFRAIYFPFNLKGEYYYCVTNAFIKSPGNVASDKTKQYAREARKLYEYFQKNIERLIEQIEEQTK